MGHSEGGIIAPMAAASRDVAFIVLLAGTGLPGRRDRLDLQGRLIAKAMGANDKALAKKLEVQKRLSRSSGPSRTRRKPSSQMRKAALRPSPKLASEDERKSLGDGHVESAAQAGPNPWFRYFLTYDPSPTLAKVKCPVLAVIGEKDLQVPPKENLTEIESVLKKAGNSTSRSRNCPASTISSRRARPATLSEYSEIEETIAPSGLALIGDWVVEQAKAR